MKEETAPAPQPNEMNAMLALEKQEIDMHIATAKKYPRDIGKALDNARALVRYDDITAREAYYSLEFYGDDSGAPVIGPSIRLAEMLASQWGNLRFGSRPGEYCDKIVKAVGFAYDLESNTYYVTEKTRSILRKNGKPFPEHLKVKAMLAAQAIAERDALFKLVPRAFANQLVKECIEGGKGKAAKPLEKRRADMIKWFAGKGVEEPEILRFLQCASVSDIGEDELVTLRAAANAIKEKTRTIEDIFGGHDGGESESGDLFEQEPPKGRTALLARVAATVQAKKISGEQYDAIVAQTMGDKPPEQWTEDDLAAILAKLEA